MGGNENSNTEKCTGALHNKISYLKNCSNRISKKGSKTIQPTAVFIKRARGILKQYLGNVIQDAIAYAKDDRRQSITAVDIAKALKKQGHDGGKRFSAFSSDTEEKILLKDASEEKDSSEGKGSSEAKESSEGKHSFDGKDSSDGKLSSEEKDSSEKKKFF